MSPSVAHPFRIATWARCGFLGPSRVPCATIWWVALCIAPLLHWGSLFGRTLPSGSVRLLHIGPHAAPGQQQGIVHEHARWCLFYGKTDNFEPTGMCPVIHGDDVHEARGLFPAGWEFMGSRWISLKNGKRTLVRWLSTHHFVDKRGSRYIDVYGCIRFINAYYWFIVCSNLIVISCEFRIHVSDWISMRQ